MLTTAQKKTYLNQNEITLFTYSGRFADAPQKYRHIFRDLSAGVYAIDEANRIVYTDPVEGLTPAELSSRAWEIVVAHKLAANEGLKVEVIDNNKIVDAWDVAGHRNSVAPSWRNKAKSGLYAVYPNDVAGPYKTLADLLEDQMKHLRYDMPAASKVQGYVDKSVSRVVRDDAGNVVAIFFGEQGRELLGQLGLL